MGEKERPYRRLDEGYQPSDKDGYQPNDSKPVGNIKPPKGGSGEVSPDKN